MRTTDADLRDQLSTVNARLAALEAERADGRERRSRRWVLTAGAGVAAAGVGSVLTTADPAAAADGSPLIMGVTTNTSTNPTVLTATTTSPAFEVTNTSAPSNGAVAIYALSGAASGLISPDQAVIVADTNTTQLAAVNASSTGGYGVRARSQNSVAVFAASNVNYGVWGICDGGDAGVAGVSSSGPGVMGTSQLGPDLSATGSGRVFQVVQSTAGAPNGSSTTYAAGEQVRDSNGQLWICVTTGLGTAATWQKVAAAAPGANGGSTNMLASPFRLYDSRPGDPAAISTPKQQLQPGASNALPLTPTGLGGVPAGSIGIIGTITITDTNGAGFLALYPTGGSVPSTSNINWTATGQTVAASYACALSSSGSVTVYSGGSGPTDVILDIAGYIY